MIGNNGREPPWDMQPFSHDGSMGDMGHDMGYDGSDTVLYMVYGKVLYGEK